ncbi:MAG TPA: hypothetical protein VG274_08250 [Rhizomicrobium sp.]|nr:hypothetical protein [Rhizomicrobium sp.]
MKRKPQFIGTGLAALAGLLTMAATPTLAQYQNQPSNPQSQTAPNSGQATPGNPGAPAVQASPSYQNSTGSMQNPGKTTSAASTESLSRVSHAKTTLASAQVQDSSGQQVGQVSNVHTTRKGHATKVDITLSSSNGGQPKTISVSASKLKYDKNSNTLITDMTANDLQAMPAATSSGM